MTFKRMFYIVVASLSTIAYSVAADLPSGSTEPANFVQTCAEHGERFIGIPSTDVCIRFSGDARGRFEFNKVSAEDGKMDFSGRGRIAFDARRLTNLGDVRTFIHLQVDDEGKVSGESGFAQIGGFLAGYSSSFGNLNYGDYALNANNGWRSTSNTVPMIGYSLELENLGTTVSLGVERPTGKAQYIPDFGAGVELELNKYKFGIGGGGVYHYFKEGEYITSYTIHPDYLKLSETEKESLADPVDLNSFGFYGGGGIEIPIPGLKNSKDEPTTFFAATGLFSRAALSKTGIPEVTIPYRIAECKGENCTKIENAGRPTVNTMEITRDEYNKSGFDKTSLDMITLFDEDAFLGTLDIPEENKGYIQEIKSNTGFTAQGGLSHQFGEQIKVAANGGIFSATERDWSVFGLQAAASINYSPIDGLNFILGGDFYSASYSSADEKIQEEIDADQTNSIDPSYSVTFEVSQSF